MISKQAQEMLARIELNKDLSEKGKQRIWRICNTKNNGNNTTFTFESQEPLDFKLQYTISNY